MAGRKRKVGVIRDRSGKSRGEPIGIHPETLAIRERQLRADGVPLTMQKKEYTPLGWQTVEKRTAEDGLSGFTLGKLLLRWRANKNDPGGVSQQQYEAGESWAKICRQHAHIRGTNRAPGSPWFTLVGGGSSSGDMDDETVQRIRRQFSECFDVLMVETRTHGQGVWRVTYGCAVENWPLKQLNSEDYGHLRTGLNALSKVLG
jgi:hypothetical protein